MLVFALHNTIIHFSVAESDINAIISIGNLKIHKDKQIGNGMFGCVFQGEIQNRLCAVKVLVESGRVSGRI